MGLGSSLQPPEEGKGFLLKSPGTFPCKHALCPQSRQCLILMKLVVPSPDRCCRADGSQKANLKVRASKGLYVFKRCAGKRELNPDKGALIERKFFCALSTWGTKKDYSASPQENKAYSGMSGAHGAFSWGGMGVQGLITAPLPFNTKWGLVLIRNRALVFGK